MSARGLAVVILLASLLLIGAASADWAVVTVEETFDAEEGTVADAVVIARTETVPGPARAGGLVALGLAGMVLALIHLRWPPASLVLAGLAATGAVLLARGWPDEGEVTIAPSLVAVALVVWLIVLLLDWRRGFGSDPRVRAGGGSRYTVEAVRGETTATAGDDDVDEWDAAVGQDER